MTAQVPAGLQQRLCRVLRASSGHAEGEAEKGVPEQQGNAPIPVAQWVAWRGELRPTYDFDDILAASLPEMLKERMQWLWETYATKLVRFRSAP